MMIHKNNKNNKNMEEDNKDVKIESVNTESVNTEQNNIESNESENKKEYSGANERRKGGRGRRESDKINIAELKKELSEKNDAVSKLSSEIESLKDLMLRRQADFDNYKKRNLKQQSDYKKMVIKDLGLDIILINDDLLRALEASSNISNENSSEDTHRSFVEGVSMISKRIEETLSKYGIEVVESMGQEFDPNFNEAVEIEMSSDVQIDTITKVYQKGFRIEDIVVRSAKVKVTKPIKQEINESNVSNVSHTNENTQNIEIEEKKEN